MSIANRYRMMMEDERQLNLDYLQHLYRFGKSSRYLADGVTFDATITGVNHYGMLEMRTDTGEYRAFGFKEIKFTMGRQEYAVR